MSTALVAIAGIAAGACTDTVLGPPSPDAHGALFDDLWTQFDLHYSFFQLKGVNWDSLSQVYRPLAVAAPTDQAFAAVLGQLLAPLRDVHVSVTPSGGGQSIRYVSPFETLPTWFNGPLVIAHYVPAAQTTVGGHLTYGMVAPTVGYIRIASFAGSGWASEMDAALAALPGAHTAIIDVRNNRGGDYATAVAVAGRFAGHEQTFGYIRRRNGPSHDDFTDEVAEKVVPSSASPFGGHVVVLANRGSFSSAENFVLAMRSLAAVTVIGDTTAGASGGAIVRELANGWTYQLSEWIEYTLAHEPYEGIGLVPDIVVRGTALDESRAVDAVLERALRFAAQ